MPEKDNYQILSRFLRDGTSQQGRYTDALNPDFAKIDERTIQDFLVYAKDFAKQLNFYDEQNQIDGNWEDFFSNDVSFILASIEKTNPEINRNAFQKICTSKVSVDGLFKLFERTLQLIKKIDDWYSVLPVRNGMRDRISRMVRANLNFFLPQLWSYEKGAYVSFCNAGFPNPEKRKDEYDAISTIWNLHNIDDIEADASLFRPIWEPKNAWDLPPNPSEDEKLETGYKNLNARYTDLYNVYFQIVNSAASEFENSLLEGDHEPHVALFIAFIRLYQQVQGDINKLTDKHLDFFYKNVLQLKLKKPIPDKAHLYFTLAKYIDEFKLSKNTRFLAGKDENGKLRYYTLNEDVVLNKAQIDTVSTVFVERIEDEETDEINFNSIYAAPAANSSDGIGGEFTDEDKPSWITFGSNAMPQATIGFAIASHELFLAEGTRTVYLTIHYNGTPIALNQLGLKAELTSEEGWFEPNSVQFLSVKPNENADNEGSNTNMSISFKKANEVSGAENSFVIKLELDSDKPAVIGFDEKVLEEKLGTKLPVLRFTSIATADNTKNTTIDVLKDITISSIAIDVAVKGVKQLKAYNDLSVIDTSKSFPPFGVSPVKNSSFYIGSPEAFHKKLTSINFNIEWENLPGNFDEYYVAYDTKPTNDITVNVTDLGTARPSTQNPIISEIKLLQDDDKDCDYKFYPIPSDEADTFGKNTKVDLFKLTLNGDFGHDQYANVLARQSVAVGSLPQTKYVTGAWYIDGNDVTFKLEHTRPQDNKDEEDVIINPSPYTAILPNEPYTPTISSISLDYTSSSVINSVKQEESFLLHIHPFSNAYEQFLQLNNEQFLLPQLHKLRIKDKFENIEGCLLLGIKDLKPGQSLSVLFQVAENTADARIDTAVIQWQYLINNNWFDFKEYEITKDTTRGLLTSGIITFAIPRTIATGNTILNSNLHWLRAKVKENSKAVSELIGIHTQAVQVVFQDNENASSHLEQPLESGVIAKMEKDKSAIDSINQDYESFGGRAFEKPLKFYNRVSERLRHKGRAITIYDYERLVLEEFPDIYKVKCINHTKVDLTENKDQLAPGHVLVAVIPDYTNMKAVDKMQPKVTKAKLEEIREFLEDRSTSFVDTFKKNDQTKHYLNVVNPVYKKIWVQFNVKFTSEITAVEFYKRELAQSIVEYLSPWAFDSTGELNFSGKVYKSSIQKFVEDREYVDFVTNFRLFDEHDSVDVNVVEADSARTILVPDEASKFTISMIEECATKNTVTEDYLGYVPIQEILLNNNETKS